MYNNKTNGCPKGQPFVLLLSFTLYQTANQLLTRSNLFIFNIEDRIMIAMTEVVIHTTLSNRNNYLHILICF